MLVAAPASAVALFTKSLPVLAAPAAAPELVLTEFPEPAEPNFIEGWYDLGG